MGCKHIFTRIPNSAGVSGLTFTISQSFPVPENRTGQIEVCLLPDEWYFAYVIQCPGFSPSKVGAIDYQCIGFSKSLLFH